MIETVAAIFGLSVDEFVKIIGAFAMGAATIIGAVGNVIAKLRGARKRSFQKIRRLEDIVQRMADCNSSPELMRLVADMKADQRDDSDAKDQG